MAKKVYDICLRGSEYQGRDGKTHTNWENVGAVWENDKGNLFITLKATFNPAGVPLEQGRNSIMLSCFAPQNKNGQGNGGYQQDGGYQGNYQQGGYQNNGGYQQGSYQQGGYQDAYQDAQPMGPQGYSSDSLGIPF